MTENKKKLVEITGEDALKAEIAYSNLLLQRKNKIIIEHKKAIKNLLRQNLELTDGKTKLNIALLDEEIAAHEKEAGEFDKDAIALMVSCGLTKHAVLGSTPKSLGFDQEANPTSFYARDDMSLDSSEVDDLLVEDADYAVHHSKE